ncbi:MAG: hypothetical protein CL678_10680 [Bdellovibrionaceae bacterium]|nr:hypothetical protein [Pseudobdellovibrionaceae bacterium]
MLQAQATLSQSILPLHLKLIRSVRVEKYRQILHLKSKRRDFCLRCARLSESRYDSREVDVRVQLARTLLRKTHFLSSPSRTTKGITSASPDLPLAFC